MVRSPVIDVAAVHAGTHEIPSGLEVLLEARSRAALDKLARAAAPVADVVRQELAIVAGEDAIFGMARIYQTLTENNVPHVAVFRDPDTATRWLGIATGGEAPSGS